MSESEFSEFKNFQNEEEAYKHPLSTYLHLKAKMTNKINQSPG